MVNTNLSIWILLFCLLGCSVQSRKDQDSLKKYFKTKAFDQAEAFLNQSSLKKEKENRLLYLMELGNLYYYQEKYRKSARVFNEANEFVDQLYTKSIKEALASSIINDNSKSYYGAIFERSQLYMMKALSFWKLATRGYYFKTKKVDGQDKELKVELSTNEIRKNKDRVRATLVAWDSFFQDISRIKGIKTFQKNDFLAKVFAAQLHEALGEKRDNQIALQLYQDAYDIFIELAPTQKVFNKEYKNYNKQLKDFYNQDIKRSSVVAKTMTNNFKQTNDFLKYKILKLAKAYRPSLISRLKNKLKPSNNILKKINKKTISLHIERGFITGLEGRDFSFNLRSAVDSIEDPNTRALVNGIGVPILTYFALGPLGLGYASHHGNVTVYSRHGAGELLTKEVGIEFELPYAKASEFDKTAYLVIKQKDKVVLKERINVISSLSDTLFIHAQEMIANSFNKRASRVGVKYILAIVAAYKTYETMKETSGELFAKPAAVAQFLISQKGIKETEKADVRHWSSLPSEHMLVDMALSNGNYDLYYVESTRDTKNREISLGNIIINNGQKTFFTYRTF